MGRNVLSAESALVEEEAAGSAVSWAAVLAGAFVASASSMALLALGAGLGLVSASPFSNANPSATTFGLMAAVWLIAVQLLASGLGGYLAGRLRTRRVGVHTDEVSFRDRAHGLLVWSVGAVVSAVLVSSTVSTAVSGVARVGETAVQAVGSATGGAASQLAGQAANASAYFTDMLFRTDRPSGDQSAPVAEVGRIFARSLSSGDLNAADKTYVAQVIASRTGLSQADAEKRVTDTLDQAKNAAAQAAEKAKEAADAARKAGASVAIWGFISLLLGAFAAAYMAALGGKARDAKIAAV